MCWIRSKYERARLIVLLYRAANLWAEGKPVKALRMIEEAEKRYPITAKIYLIKASLHCELGEEQKALTCLEEAHKKLEASDAYSHDTRNYLLAYIFMVINYIENKIKKHLTLKEKIKPRPFNITKVSRWTANMLPMRDNPIRLAAEQGSKEAQRDLAIMYEQGREVPLDHGEAAKWYRRAAEQGDLESQFQLGMKCRKGRGVPVDFREAEMWLRRAAERGYGRAQMGLGVLYARGEGVPNDSLEAYVWFRRAEETESEASREMIATISKGMTPEQIAEAEKRYGRSKAGLDPDGSSKN